MKYLVLLAMIIGGSIWGLLTGVRDRNAAVTTGTAAYARGDAARAAAAFEAALRTQARRAPDPRLMLDLAHAQIQAGQFSAARQSYGRLLTSSPATLNSVAHQQLAVITARQGEVARALSLLRQALLLDPQNSYARFDYEVLSDYLAQESSGPKITPPPPGRPPGAPKPTPEKGGPEKNQPAEKAGTDHQGKINDSQPAPTTPNPAPQRRPNATGQPDNRQPGALPGPAAPGGRQPGAGPAQPLASGDTPGAQRGLDRRSATSGPNAPGSRRPGTDAAAPNDTRLQTQRERLQAMNLTPAQARRLLETLRAQEQQYLQQLTRPSPQKPDPNKPSW